WAWGLLSMGNLKFRQLESDGANGELLCDFIFSGSHLRRDHVVSVLYAEELHATTSAVFLQRTARQGIVGPRSSALPRVLCPRHAEPPPRGPSARVLPAPWASSPPGDGTPRGLPSVVGVGNRRRARVASAPGGGAPLSCRPPAR